MMDQLTPRPLHTDRNPFTFTQNGRGNLTASAPSVALTLTTPVFNMQNPPAPKNNSLTSSATLGQIHINIISAKSLNLSSSTAKPYVVVQFEMNDFVGSDPVPTSMDALGAIQTGLLNVPHSPVWKSQVSFDVTSPESLVTFTVYDRSLPEHAFLGSVQIRPSLMHDHTLDGWYNLKPIPPSPSPVTGALRIQISFTNPTSKIPLTPASFEFLKLIGRGTFGKVFQVRKRDTHRIYAMKVLSKKEIVLKKEVAHTIGERKILHISLSCPFLVGLKFSFQTKDELFLVTDFKSGGELFWHLQRETRFSEERARFYIAELILALEHLHKHGIIYRDLKPENILLDATGHLALCDFGLSKLTASPPSTPYNGFNPSQPSFLTTTFCGTTEYLAPEILLSESGYSKEVDFWSLGVLLFEMCCGWSPFYAEETQQMYKNICFGKIRFPRGVIGDDGKAFVKGLLNRNPRHRLGATRDAEELKEHKFFAAIDWNLLEKRQVTPPFKPVVESDESTNNFDPEFTGADLREFESLVGPATPEAVEAEPVAEGSEEDEWLDESDPSESWVEQSLVPGSVHQPLGPLGSDRDPGLTTPPIVSGNNTPKHIPTTKSSTSPTKSTATKKTKTSPSSSISSSKPAAISSKGTPPTNDVSSSKGTPNGKSNARGAIDISKPKKNEVPGGTNSVLTNSVQEKFKGFTFSGGESVMAMGSTGVLAQRAEEREKANGKAVNGTKKTRGEDSASGGETTDSEFEDFGKSAGRYAHTRRKGLGFTELDDDAAF
ncbi:kinase-like protein [Mycena floridula]|nr:kinase-like protein [Mycena floridula]